MTLKKPLNDHEKLLNLPVERNLGWLNAYICFNIYIDTPTDNMADGHVLQGSSPATMRKQLNLSELAESLSTIVQGQGMNISL